MKVFVVLSALFAAGSCAVLLPTGKVAGPVHPAFGSVVATRRGLKDIALEGYSEDDNQDGFVDPIGQAVPHTYAAPFFHHYAAPVPVTHYTAPVVTAVKEVAPVEVKEVEVEPVEVNPSPGIVYSAPSAVKTIAPVAPVAPVVRYATPAVQYATPVVQYATPVVHKVAPVAPVVYHQPVTHTYTVPRTYTTTQHIGTHTYTVPTGYHLGGLVPAVAPVEVKAEEMPAAVAEE